jgi:hypothetical protein
VRPLAWGLTTPVCIDGCMEMALDGDFGPRIPHMNCVPCWRRAAAQTARAAHAAHLPAVSLLLAAAADADGDDVLLLLLLLLGLLHHETRLRLRHKQLLALQGGRACVDAGSVPLCDQQQQVESSTNT